MEQIFERIKQCLLFLYSNVYVCIKQYLPSKIYFYITLERVISDDITKNIFIKSIVE